MILILMNYYFKNIAERLVSKRDAPISLNHVVWTCVVQKSNWGGEGSTPRGDDNGGPDTCG